MTAFPFDPITDALAQLRDAGSSGPLEEGTHETD